eukprot:CAMPEP_0172530044 /NCGR_PEP_ID=MMETSP1067-20121228/3914_1 /TAXON_ID=265564 ORGANISM="Thalassiosira punctigera, Strain Tpunct2005C2" /NCGR_SAMPLE_ID=MMETSP1067 /ASSEMBLY_ACC=CAM_ASM_000444 /LENGTH=100 /DNA_ID=CAMNT_0013314187 /DNA_START=720 /DNA_END=1022 /DNA_ORIENTATION=+
MIACCNGAYGGQVSGKCLAALPSPPATSSTSAGGFLEVYYPDYDTVWRSATCINDQPLPSGRPTYSSKSRRAARVRMRARPATLACATLWASASLALVWQ